MALTKKKRYKRTKFTPEVLREALSRIGPADKMKPVSMDVELANEVEWSFDELNEFLAAYRASDIQSAHMNFQELGGWANLTVSFSGHATRVRVQKTLRSEIERVFEVFEDSADACALPKETEQSIKDRLVIFVGHGRNPAWRDVKDHLQDKHGYQVTAYETGPRVGLHIADVLEAMEDEASFAILVMTGENEDQKGELHARENVIHEVGLFQGRLGFRRAIVLLEDGCSEFSNLSGVQYIPFAKGNIRETFGEILATIRREFDAE
ncbi:nucleotide-binding protein [uncultured Bradyrhizobium sp.]|jgi:predicted nucleotide-binding protein|uniref:nucleotide-binding protein n=1 Tax=uncultured Bradyrhizobium sp. TaxID=199684 RepID=UPI0026272EA9|nr:nucleotide-binding protein [uncultured Bradyrhizobium sp.]